MPPRPPLTKPTPQGTQYRFLEQQAASGKYEGHLPEVERAVTTRRPVGLKEKNTLTA